MSMLHATGVEGIVEALAVDAHPVLAEMEERAERDNFPTVGREVGGFLRWLTVTADISRIFECGSGYGYSAFWTATVLPPEGEIVLTEVDADELADAREYLERADVTAALRYERADALEVLSEEDGQFDLILLDHENERYREGFEIAAERIAPGGIIIADNVMHSWEFDPIDVDAGLNDDGAVTDNPSLAGILEYYRHVQGRSDFQTTALPLGEGLLVSTHYGV